MLSFGKNKYYLPALLSFFVIGLGQLVKGDSRKALLWFLLFYIFIPGLLYASLMLHAYAFILIACAAVIVYPVFWLYNVLDAFLSRPEII